MPAGAAPGEYRGGRQKGTPNKATSLKRKEVDEALAKAFEVVPPEEIDRMTPATVMLTAMRGLVKANLIPAAISIAKEAAPYFDAKISPTPPATDEDRSIVIKGGLPDA